MTEKEIMRIQLQIDELRQKRSRLQNTIDQDMLLYNNTSSPIRRSKLKKKIDEDEQEIIKIQREIDAFKRQLPATR